MRTHHAAAARAEAKICVSVRLSDACKGLLAGADMPTPPELTIVGLPYFALRIHIGTWLWEKGAATAIVPLLA